MIHRGVFFFIIIQRMIEQPAISSSQCDPLTPRHQHLHLQLALFHLWSQSLASDRLSLVWTLVVFGCFSQCVMSWDTEINSVEKFVEKRESVEFLHKFGSSL